MHSLPHMITWHGIPVFFREWHEEVVCCGMEGISTLMINKYRMKDISNKGSWVVLFSRNKVFTEGNSLLCSLKIPNFQMIQVSKCLLCVILL